ncbi:hypothetical protein DL771_006815 [Monosporascus sp. 5C6A]|nr:hypothetical protein DL771_006815 [Monosporascus sp. 5C6A]
MPLIPPRYFLEYFRSQLFTTLPRQSNSFAGQTVIVTGSNTGLGLEAARHIVHLGASKVILAVRDTSKGDSAKRSIEESTGQLDIVEVWHLDLSSYQSVKSFAKRASDLDRLDVVVENAGKLTHDFSMAEDNESTITVNVVSTMLLALLLLPKLRETSQRLDRAVVLTFTGSFIHWLTNLPERNEERILEACAIKEKARMRDRYNVSKLLELLAVRELANELSASTKPGKIICSILNPGTVVTGMDREGHGIRSALFQVFLKLVGRSAEEASRTLVHAAQGLEDTHGQYLDDCKVGSTSIFVRSEEGFKLQKRFWTELIEKLEAIEPGIAGNV